MNALELADVLERLHEQDLIDGVADLAMPEAATMLRQLHAEKEALEKSQRFAQSFAEEQHKRAVEAEAEIEALKAELKELNDEAEKEDAEHEKNWNEAYGK